MISDKGSAFTDFFIESHRELVLFATDTPQVNGSIITILLKKGYIIKLMGKNYC